MPGIFGVVGEGRGIYAGLVRSYEAIWGRVEERTLSSARIGAHAFRGQALLDVPGGSVLAVDGVARAYHGTAADPRDRVVCGNLVVVDREGVRLMADDAGAFPLHYVRLPGGFAFSSLLRPLARAVAASSDPVGVATFLRYGYTFGGRTLFENVRRLLPGEMVRFDVATGVESEDRSQAWVGVREELGTPEAAAKAARDLLIRSLPAGTTDQDEGRRLLMMSAGWDSRTLLAGLDAGGGAAALAGYSHGDPASRELLIARQLCAVVDMPWSARPIGEDVWDLEHLQWTFARTGTLVFPHWGWAGRGGAQLRYTLSGVLGEVLGGHYGETQVRQGGGKALALLRGVRPSGASEHATQDPDGLRDAVTRMLSVEELGRPWYLNPGVEDRDQLRGAMNDDVREHLDRLVRRGVTQRELLIEAFVTEHRGARYICAQALSARGSADIAIPFGEPEFFRFATSIPPHVKIHNRVNRALIRLLAPDLERFPMAATLVPAHWPLLTQEASRAVRKVYEEGRWALHRWSGRRLEPPRLGWVNFQFLREGRVLEGVLESLQADLWDRPALEGMARRVCGDLDGRNLHPLFDQLGKILTVDRLISGTTA